MVIMSVDCGDVRTGLAVCDRDELLASPVGVIIQRDRVRLAEEIGLRAEQLRAELIVVGLPRNMDGSEGFRAAECREFAQLLREKSSLGVELYDERLTTVGAHHALNATNTRGKKRKNIVDAVAAVMLLEDYMRLRKNTNSAQN